MTEVGVDAIVPWQAARCVARGRTTGRCTSGEPPCGRRSSSPAGPGCRRWPSRREQRTWRGGSAGAAAALVLHEEAELPLSTVELPRTGEIVLVVGPEGGIAPEELAVFVAGGATPVRMGDAVLRTSTAGAAAVAALSVRLGRW